jgi:tRNA G18 (ribose-2'-O)-methylase SpoU
VIPVASLDDPRVAAYRWVAQPERLLDDGLFAVEGRLVVPRLLALSAEPGRWFGAAVSALLSPAAYERMHAVIDAYATVPSYVAPQQVIDGLVGFNMHRGCLALAKRPPAHFIDSYDLSDSHRAIVLEGVNNPDNVGGIFRSAAAFDAGLVMLGPSCADPLYRKLIRTSMGATLEVPYVSSGEWPAALDRLRDQDFEVAALTTDNAAVPIDQYRPKKARVALLAGAVGPGLSDSALARADVHVTIPMPGRVDSLNVATAVAIALYHVTVSQRR